MKVYVVKVYCDENKSREARSAIYFTNVSKLVRALKRNHEYLGINSGLKIEDFVYEWGEFDCRKFNNNAKFATIEDHFLNDW